MIFLYFFSRHHKHKQPADPEATNIGSVVGAEAEVLNPEELQKKFEEREHKREKKSRKHRSSLLEGTLPLTEDNFKSFTTNEMERGLLETLMATSDSSTLKRNKVNIVSYLFTFYLFTFIKLFVYFFYYRIDENRLRRDVKDEKEVEQVTKLKDPVLEKIMF